MNSEARSLIFEKIKTYLESTGVKRSTVTEQSLLYHDLGFRGTDAYMFMQFIVREFEVDLADFHFKTYFHDEYFGVLDIVRAVFRLYDNSRKPMSVRSVVDACLTKKWSPPKSELVEKELGSDTK